MIQFGKYLNAFVFCMQQEQDFPWNTKERGLILSSFFWGYITTQFLGGLFGAKIGGNLVNMQKKNLLINNKRFYENSQSDITYHLSAI